MFIVYFTLLQIQNQFKRGSNSADCVSCNPGSGFSRTPPEFAFDRPSENLISLYHDQQIIMIIISLYHDGHVYLGCDQIVGLEDVHWRNLAGTHFAYLYHRS